MHEFGEVRQHCSFPTCTSTGGEQGVSGGCALVWGGSTSFMEGSRQLQHRGTQLLPGDNQIHRVLDCYNR